MDARWDPCVVLLQGTGSGKPENRTQNEQVVMFFLNHLDEHHSPAFVRSLNPPGLGLVGPGP